MIQPGQQGSPIEEYLEPLVRAGRNGNPRRLLYLLAERKAHLRDAAAVAQTSGLSTFAAEADSVARFGPASEVNCAEEVRSRPSYRQLLIQYGWSVTLLGGVGAAAVGVSGVIAAIVRAAGGTEYTHARTTFHLTPSRAWSPS